MLRLQNFRTLNFLLWCLATDQTRSSLPAEIPGSSTLSLFGFGLLFGGALPCRKKKLLSGVQA